MFGSMVASLRSSTTMGGASALLEDCGIDVAKWLEGATSIAGCRLVGISKTFFHKVDKPEDLIDQLVELASRISAAFSASLSTDCPFV